MRSHVISFRLSLVLLLFCFVLLAACGQSTSPTTGAKPTPTPTVALDVYGGTTMRCTDCSSREVLWYIARLLLSDSLIRDEEARTM